MLGADIAGQARKEMQVNNAATGRLA